MLFAVQKNESSWSVTPQTGKFAGQVVAEVEGIDLRDVEVQGRTLVGKIKAMWGAVILIDEVYEDAEMLRSLGITGRFDFAPRSRLWIDFDGVHDAKDHTIGGASCVVLMGDNMSGRGFR